MILQYAKLIACRTSSLHNPTAVIVTCLAWQICGLGLMRLERERHADSVTIRQIFTTSKQILILGPQVAIKHQYPSQIQNWNIYIQTASFPSGLRRFMNYIFHEFVFVYLDNLLVCLSPREKPQCLVKIFKLFSCFWHLHVLAVE